MKHTQSPLMLNDIKAATWRRKNRLYSKKKILLLSWLTDLRAGLVHIYASSTAGNWKKWVITLLSHGIMDLSISKLDVKLLLYAQTTRRLTPSSSKHLLPAVLMHAGEITPTEVVWGDKRPELALLGAELMCSHLFLRLLKWKWKEKKMLCNVTRTGQVQPQSAFCGHVLYLCAV